MPVTTLRFFVTVILITIPDFLFSQINVSLEEVKDGHAFGSEWRVYADLCDYKTLPRCLYRNRDRVVEIESNPCYKRDTLFKSKKNPEGEYRVSGKFTRLPCWIKKMKLLRELSLGYYDHINWSKQLRKIEHLENLKSLSIETWKFNANLLDRIIAMKQLTSFTLNGYCFPSENDPYLLKLKARFGENFGYSYTSHE